MPEMVHEYRTVEECNVKREACGRFRVLPTILLSAVFIIASLTWGVTIGQEVVSNRKDIENIMKELDGLRIEQQMYFERVIKILEKK